MKRIKSEELYEGMIFSAPLFFDDGVNMFLAKRKPLKKHHIAALKRWNIPFVLTYGTLYTDPSVDLLDEEIADLEEFEEVLEEIDEVDGVQLPSHNTLLQIAQNFSSTNELISKNITSAVKRLQNVFAAILSNAPVPRSEVDSIAELIYSLISPNWMDAISYIMTELKAAGYAQKGVVSAVFSAAIAEYKGIPKRFTIQLIAASLLHDTGMLTVSDQILQKQTQLSKSEYDLLKLHPLRSARFASEVLFFPKEVSQTIIQHHERCNGSGYPEGLMGDQIQTGAKILGITDTFTSMLSHKTYSKSLGGFEAMKVILMNEDSKFDPEILQSFLKVMGYHPLGTIVLLSNGCVAQVTKANEELPFLPVIKILSNPITPKTPDLKAGETVDLNQGGKLCILRALKADEYKVSA